MGRQLTDRERNVALFLIRHATASPSPGKYAGFSDDMKAHWKRPDVISAERRASWERNLDSVTVKSECGCGTCPTILFDAAAFDPPHRHSQCVVLEAGVRGFESTMLLLHIDDDVPRELELAPGSDDLELTDFPPTDVIDC